LARIGLGDRAAIEAAREAVGWGFSKPDGPGMPSPAPARKYSLAVNLLGAGWVLWLGEF